MQETIVPGIKSKDTKTISLVCPDCAGRSLMIAKSIELGSDRDYDETSFQAIQCVKCNMVGVSLYQESRRGAEDSWQHFGHRMEETNFNLLLKQLTKCSYPRQHKCNCEAHVYFGAKKDNGALHPLDRLSYDPDRFYIRSLF